MSDQARFHVESKETMLPPADANELLRHLTAELENFEDIAGYLLPQPGELPRLRWIDVYGGTLALSGAVGGDHIIYLDFKQRFDLEARIERAVDEGKLEVAENLKRCQRTAGIALLDVSGHRVTDALLAAMLHQAFLLGSIYELDMFGQITKRLFENLNTRFYRSSGSHKFVSMIYGEISEDSCFRFLSAAQPFPIVFSKRHDRFMDVDPSRCVSFPPLGVLPSLGGIDRSTTHSSLGFTDQYELNEWSLMGEGDILLLQTDGLAEHRNGDEAYFPTRLEATLRRVQHQTAREIFSAVQDDLLEFNAPSDDISMVVIKRT
jgi:serine phosphatase RsbU (regulator of sigma subunit)